jgi:hypothetical protein
VEKNLSFWEKLALDLNSQALAGIGRSAVPEFARGWLTPPELHNQLALLRSLGSNKIGVFAYCFCEIR